MRLISRLIASSLLLASNLFAFAVEPQRPIWSSDNGPSPSSVSAGFFADLERLARLVDITYCVGTTGISPPFACASRCNEFPTLQLASTWNTGVLMSDSCGYIAVDHGQPRLGGDGEKGAIIVAFRGTYSITNTVVDLSTVPQEYVPYPEPDHGVGVDETEPEHRCANCTVHMGFLASWRQARKLVLPVLKSIKARNPGYSVHLVGHSLGGAVAGLAALELKVVHGWDDLVVTTFGEPQTGNKGFVNFFDKVFKLDDDDGYDPDLEKRIYRRVTHVDDPVPLLPLSEWGFRSHAGEVFITKPNLPPAMSDLRLCRGDKDPSCITGEDQQFSWLSKLKPWELFFAHRDYFWRLGLCVPGGDPIDWGREPYNNSHQDEL